MFKVQMLRACVNQRLTAAAEEIFELFESLIAEYEEELCRAKEKQRRILDSVYNPEVCLNKTEIQQLLDDKDVPAEQHEWSPGLDQADPPGPPLMKEEQEVIWVSPDGEQFEGLEEADVIKFSFTPVPVKSEEEKNQWLPFQQNQTEESRDSDSEYLRMEAEEEDYGHSKLDLHFNPKSHLQPDTTDESDSTCVWENMDESQSGLNRLQNNGDFKFKQEETLISTSKPAESPNQKEKQQKNAGVQKRAKPYSCSICEISFALRSSLVIHMRVHTGERPYRCDVCGYRFTQHGALKRHMNSHTGEKPYTCSVCERKFARLEYVRKHKCAGRNKDTPE